MPTKDAFKIIDLGNNDKTVENCHNYLQAEVMSYYIESNEKYYEIKCIFEKVIFSLVKKGYIHFIFSLNENITFWIASDLSFYLLHSTSELQTPIAFLSLKTRKSKTKTAIC